MSGQICSEIKNWMAWFLGTIAGGDTCEKEVLDIGFNRKRHHVSGWRFRLNRFKV
jgi:hypothetical protein